MDMDIYNNFYKNDPSFKEWLVNQRKLNINNCWICMDKTKNNLIDIIDIYKNPLELEFMKNKCLGLKFLCKNCLKKRTLNEEKEREEDINELVKLYFYLFLINICKKK
jgi:hypothetical protein